MKKASAIAKPLAKPFLKWAGGKTQLLQDILPKIPTSYGKYIEPFLGGGALYFALQPKKSVIADSNPELINMYRQIARHTEDVIGYLKKYSNTEKFFYEVRGLDWTQLPPAEAAARMIFLNKTCFNGLYRVNKQGQFNVPFGRYKNPTFCDPDALHIAAGILKKATILCDDYLSVLKRYAEPGDFVFLDPPYLPVSEYADFKRYTKEQFYEEDHVELAKEVSRLYEEGCHVVLTNSNHPLVHELYGAFHLDVVQTKRHISRKASGRKGEDVIVTISPEKPLDFSTPRENLSKQVEAYPPTRFMGAKGKLLTQIWTIASQFRFHTVLDLFSGSGIVGYMFKSQGKTVISNDYMAMSATYAKSMIENNTVTLPIEAAKKLLVPVKKNSRNADHFVEKTFHGLYFSDADNALIDILRTNIASLRDPYRRAIAMSALIRACIKKRPRGVFTYVGQRYNDGRQDLRKSLETQFLEAVEAVNGAVFDNGKTNKARQGDAMQLAAEPSSLVYIDPPYYSPLSDNEYVRRYHFVEGLARNWQGVEIQEHTQTKKFKSYPTPFSTRNGAAEAFDLLFKKHKNAVLLVSYSSNSLPTLDEMVGILSRYKKHVEVVPVEHRYSFGNQGHKVGDNKNKVQEYLFVGY